MKRLLWERLLRFVYPPRCVVCGRVTAGGGVLCGDLCAQRLAAWRLPPEPVRTQSSGVTVLQYAAFRYDGVPRDIVRRMKFWGKEYLARDMASFLADSCAQLSLPHDAVVVHVPSYRRGDDRVTALLAGTFASRMGLAFQKELLRKVKDTPKQHRSTLSERRVGQRGAFEASLPGALQGRLFVLVDDVVTTGSTLRECVDALVRAGAGGVTALVLCRTEEQAG